METVLVQINNNEARDHLQNLEKQHLIKVLRDLPYSVNQLFYHKQVSEQDRMKRLSEIRSITKDIHLDLTNFCFDRNEANNYDD